MNPGKTLLVLAIISLNSCTQENEAPLAVVQSNEISDIAYTSAKGGGVIISDGGSSVVQRGVCWSQNPSPTIDNDKTSDGSGGGTFLSSITGLTPNTNYYVRAYATNSNGTSYGLSYSFKTKASVIPEITTTDVTSVLLTSALSGGSVVSDGGLPVIERGVCWSTNSNPTIQDSKTTNGEGSANFQVEITGLMSGTTYYLRAYATNNVGTGYGNQVSFKTYSPPVLTTGPIQMVTITSAIIGGNVISADGSILKGICWGTNPSPTTSDNLIPEEDGLGQFQGRLTELTSGTKYYFRAYVINSLGTSYGDELTFTTSKFMTGPTDSDGNVYSSVVIGDQIWMVENLRTTKYLNGELIPNITDNSQWNSTTSGAWSYYNNNDTFDDPYGKLYNWFAVTDSRKLCPNGWHIPNYNEWIILETYLGGTSDGEADIRMKEEGVSHWPSPNTDATNESGFTGIPGGRRYGSGAFEGFSSYGNWWSSTVSASNIDLVESYFLHSLYNGSSSYLTTMHGASVRCIKD